MNSGNIIIVGAMGSGKSTIGKLLAKKLDKKYIDTDYEIEVNNNCDISTFFERYGETLFREKESEILGALADINNHVISTGGGIILKEENINLLKEIGLIVFLDIGLKAQIKRVKYRKHRPLLKNDDLYIYTFYRFINIKNKSGPKIEPCGTPKSIPIKDDLHPFNLIYCVLEFR